MEKALEVKQETNVFSMFDKFDDNQIVETMKGHIIKEYVYSYNDKKGNAVTGLSKVGVDMACRELSKQNEIIREIELTYIDDGDYANFIGKAGRYQINLENGKEILLETKIGQKRQWKKIKTKAGGIIDNPFWFEQGGQKCIRNARRDLIPHTLITELIGNWSKTGHVKNVNSNNGSDKFYNDGKNLKFNFGKHKDKLVQDVPTTYYEYLLESDNPPKGIEIAVYTAMAIKIKSLKFDPAYISDTISNVYKAKDLKVLTPQEQIKLYKDLKEEKESQKELPNFDDSDIPKEEEKI